MASQRFAHSHRHWNVCYTAYWYNSICTILQRYATPNRQYCRTAPAYSYSYNTTQNADTYPYDTSTTYYTCYTYAQASCTNCYLAAALPSDICCIYTPITGSATVRPSTTYPTTTQFSAISACSNRPYPLPSNYPYSP
jgi:hypothetical protein